jgi:two-component system, chemotaxis family, response regulator Rcp1
MPRPALSWLDLNVPRKDGREVVAETTQVTDFKSILVVLTTKAAEQDLLGPDNRRAHRYITKSGDLEQSLTAMKAIEDIWLTVVTRPPA